MASIELEEYESKLDDACVPNLYYRDYGDGEDEFITDLPEESDIWLPYQSQLQAMMDIELDNLLRGFVNWVGSCGDGFCWYIQEMYPYVEGRYSYTECFKTMEQLWLAFVMEKKFSKVWNGKEWVGRDGLTD